MDLEPCEVTLRDGSQALIRPIQPDDKERLQRGLQELSAQSRYLRFHMPVDELTEEQLRYLTEIDYDDHMAWVAIDLEDPGRPGMAVARYIRLSDDPAIAEAAVTVVDRYQGRGLGTLLLSMLARSALQSGVKVFRNYVLTENQQMLDLFEELGATRELEEPGVYRVDMPIPDDVEALPDSPAGKVFRAVAQHLTPPTWLNLPGTWFRRWTDRPRHLVIADDRPPPPGSPALNAYLDELEGDPPTGT
jgi:RimJ/RimL family protein N-acetyltransferase